MKRLTRSEFWRLGLVLLVAIFSSCSIASAQDDEEFDLIAAPAGNAGLTFLAEGSEPSSLEQLKEMQKVFSELAEEVAAATVNIAVEEAQGSGVIISRDGYILTAAHVIGRPNKEATITFADGSKAKAMTLGVNGLIDSGMLKITDKGKWPFLDIGESEPLTNGQWVMAIGHPGGLTEGRGLVYRAGRIVNMAPTVLTTDCTLVGGDSGGPLVDLDGYVIGIHSRIGGRLWDNFHVPIDQFSFEWDQLTNSEIVGSEKAFIGIELESAKGETNKIKAITKNEAADKAGIKAGDIIIQIGDDEIGNRIDIRNALGKFKPKDETIVVVKRGEEELELDVTLGYGQVVPFR